MNAEQVKAVPFSDDDWAGWAGAESWSEQAEPLIRYFGETAVVIADKNGVAIYFDPTHGATEEPDPADFNWVEFSLNVAFPTQASAKLFLDALPADLDRDAAILLGFIEV